MTKGQIMITAMLTFAAGVGTLLWWTETRAYYEPVSMEAVTIAATTFDGVVDPLPIADFEGIDADTSPLRFRACFTTPLSLATMTETYQPYDSATPLNTPGWFACYDAGDLTRALETGSGLAFLGEHNIVYGIDQIVMITDDGRGFAWHQLNHCGEAAYSGDPLPEDCPPAPERN